MRQMDPRRTVATEPPDYGDLTVPWSAKLIQPTRYQSGSAQVLVVEVTAPLVLDQPISVAVGGRFEVASWQGEPSQRRRATAMLGTALSPNPGLVNVRVQVHAGIESPVLRAGTMRVSR